MKEEGFDILYTATNDKNQRFEIRDGGDAGFYVYIYDGDNTRCTYDYLQDTLEMAIRFSKNRFGVPESAWQTVE